MWDASQSLDLDRLRIVLASVANPLLQAFYLCISRKKVRLGGMSRREGCLVGCSSLTKLPSLLGMPPNLTFCHYAMAGPMLYKLWEVLQS